MDRHWPLMSFFGSVAGFYLLLIRNPDFKFGAEDKQEWFVIAIWYGALNFIPFMLICNYLLGNQIRNKCKDSWLLNAFLNFIFLVVPAIIEHLAEYPEFHIKVKDVKQHNSQKRYELFSACSFAISSWGLSKTYDLTFESGLFFICLEHAMKISLEIVNETGKQRNIVFMFGTFGFCLMVILWRIYLEKNQASDTASQSPDNSNTTYQNQNNRTDESHFPTSDTNYFQSSDSGPMGNILTVDQQNEPSEITARNWDRTPGDCRVQDENSQRDTRQESWDINEQNWESILPRLDNNTSSSNSIDNEDGVKEDEEVPSEKNFELKEGKDGVKEDEGTSASDNYFSKINESEFASQEIEHEEENMRSSTSSKDQSQESGSHGYEVDDNPLLPKNSLAVDDDDDHDDDDFDHKSSDGDDFDSGAGSKVRVGLRRRNKCPVKEGQDITNLDSLRTAGCKVGVGRRRRNKCPAKEGKDITNSEQNSQEYIPRAKISELSDDDNNESSNDKESDEDGGAGSKDGVGQRGTNKCPVKVSKDITNLDESESWNDEDGMEDSGKHHFSPSSTNFHNDSNIDSSSVSARNETSNYKSVGSSPSENPSRVNFTSNRAGLPVQPGHERSPSSQHDDLYGQQTMAVLRKPEQGTEDAYSTDYFSDDLLIFPKQKENSQRPLDFEDNDLIWLPPPPDDENDDISVISNSLAPTTCSSETDATVRVKDTVNYRVVGAPSDACHGDLASNLTVDSGYCNQQYESKGEAILPSIARDHLKSGLQETMVQEGQQQGEIIESIKVEQIDESGLSSEYFSATDDHQSILVHFSKHCVSKGTECKLTTPSKCLKVYVSFLKPLGRYLRDELFDLRSRCQSCKEPAEAQVLCYTHKQGYLTINVRRLPSVKLPGERDGKIWMWHRCLRCPPVDGVPPATRRVVMSDATWGLSFGKFLEVSLSNHATANRVATCGHSLLRDCLRYYGFGSMVAFFRYSHLTPSTLEFGHG